MKNRNMFYQNINQGYNNPGGIIPPSGYNINTHYQSYGPNDEINQNMMSQMQSPNMIENIDYEDRISKIERQIKSLDNRIQKLESEINTNKDDNFYMI